MDNRKLFTVFVISLLTISFVNAQTVEDEINKLSGKYSGEWTAFKKDATGNIVKSFSWKDTLTTSEPIVNDTIIYVDVQSKMIFDNPNIPEYEMKFKEGFYIKDNKISKHFFTYMNNEVEQIKLDNDTFVYSQKVKAHEFPQMGFNSATEGTHTVVKVIINIDGQEIHKIKRITTIIWKDEDGNIQNTQFVSLTGYHKKTKDPDLK
jgi:hypothetical protein